MYVTFPSNKNQIFTWIWGHLEAILSSQVGKRRYYSKPRRVWRVRYSRWISRGLQSKWWSWFLLQWYSCGKQKSGGWFWAGKLSLLVLEEIWVSTDGVVWVFCRGHMGRCTQFGYGLESVKLLFNQYKGEPENKDSFIQDNIPTQKL